MTGNPFDQLLPSPAAPAPEFRWGTVTDDDPLTVMVAGVLHYPATVASVEVDDRVLVLLHEHRATVLGVAGGVEVPVLPTPVPDNHVRIGGVDYQASGSFGSISVPSFTGASPVSYTSWTQARPYTPPSGYGFDVYIIQTSRYNSVHVQDATASPLTIYLSQFYNATQGTLVLGWRLVKV